MKKLTMFLAGLFLLTSATTAFASDDRPIEVSQLPAAAQQFIKTHFQGVEVSYAKEDSEYFSKSYDVVFVNGNKVEFAKDGMWKDVDCKYSEVPAGIVPAKIREYVAKHHAGQKIVSIDRDKRDYEIELGNGIDLKFDMKFNVISIGD